MKIKLLIKDKFEIAEDIGDSDILIDYGLGVDSVSSLEFIVALEKEFSVEIDETDVTPDTLQDINSISEYLAVKL